MTLGEQIKEKREEKNLTQEDLAERIGVSRQAVSKWEGGASVPRGANREALSQLLELELPQQEECPPRRRWLEAGGWAAAAVLLLCLAGTLIWPRQQPVAEVVPSIQSIRFYDANQEEVSPVALWYNTQEIESILIQYTGDSLHTVQMFFTPSGSETMDQTQLLLTKPLTVEQGAVLLSASALHQESLMGHLHFQLDFGGDELVTSEDFNVVYAPEGLE